MGEEKSEDNITALPTLERGKRFLDLVNTNNQLELLEKVLDKSETQNRKRRNICINCAMWSTAARTRERRDKKSSVKTRRRSSLRISSKKTLLNKVKQRDAVPSYVYQTIENLQQETTDVIDPHADAMKYLMSTGPYSLHNTNQSDAASKKANDGVLSQKVLDLLKRVGLGLVTISDLSLGITASMSELILRVSGKATPKFIGGWFRFEIVRKNIFAVSFTADQAGFADFTEKLFNRRIALFEKLQDTTVC